MVISHMGSRRKTALNFEWDQEKARANKTKHGVDFSEASELFADDYSSAVPDPDHSFDEERFLIFGRTAAGRHLVAAFTDRDDRIRIISARPMTRRERRAYEQ